MNFNYLGCVGIYGNPKNPFQTGTGKTVIGVYLAYENYLAGKKIFSNIHLNFPYKPIKSFFDILDIKNSFVLADELTSFIGTTYEDSGIPRDIKGDIIRFNNQFRKAESTLIFTAQDSDELPKFIRRKVNLYYEASKIHYYNNGTLNLKDVCYDKNCDLPHVFYARAINVKGFKQESFYIPIPELVYELFDSNEIVKHIDYKEIKKEKKKVLV